MAHFLVLIDAGTSGQAASKNNRSVIACTTHWFGAFDAFHAELLNCMNVFRAGLPSGVVSSANPQTDA
jgi:hypothetical protein